METHTVEYKALWRAHIVDTRMKGRALPLPCGWSSKERRTDQTALKAGEATEAAGNRTVGWELVSEASSTGPGREAEPLPETSSLGGRA